MDAGGPRLTPTEPTVVGATTSVLWASTLAATLATLPMFLVGALAIFIRADLGFSEASLGAAASLFYVCAALSNPPGGRLAERLGGRPAMAVGAGCTFLACLGIGLLARNWLALALSLMVGGVAVGIAQPASSLALVRGVSPRRQGLAFGLKQSSGAFGTLLGGLSVPLIGLTVGWRWAFALAALLCLPLLRFHRSPPNRAAPTPVEKPVVAVRPLRYLALATLLAVMATSSVGPFYVESAVAGGISPALSGTLFAAGSLSAVLARLVWGHLAGLRLRSHFHMIGLFQGLGAASFLMLAAFRTALPLAAATLLLFAAGWGWPGVLNYAVVSRSPGAPAVAAGIVGVGQFGGGIFGPLGFGVLVETFSYRAAWTVGAALLGMAAVVTVLGGRALSAATGGR